MEKQEELKRQRRKMKEDKEKALEKAKEQAKPSAASSGTRPKPQVTGSGRALPDYFKPTAAKPSGVAGRTRAKNQPEPAKPAKPAKPVSHYQPKLRSKMNLPDNREEEKQVSRKPVKPAASSKRQVESKPQNKFSSHQDVEMQDVGVMDEIPAELLNQIYSEDLDQSEVERIQSQEYGQMNQPPPPAPVSVPVPERLIGGMDEDYRRPQRVEPRRVNRSPPPNIEHNPDAEMQPPRAEESENELIQRAIAESLKQNNPRQHPMSKYFQKDLHAVCGSAKSPLCAKFYQKVF